MKLLVPHHESAKNWLIDIGANVETMQEVLDAVYEGEMSPREAAFHLGLEPTHGCALYTVEDAISEAAS